MDDSTSSASANHPFLEAPPETLNVEKAIANLIEQTRPNSPLRSRITLNELSPPSPG